MFGWLAVVASGAAVASEPQPAMVGFARRDITPSYPIRLSGYNSRKTESEGVEQRLWAKALAVGADRDGPAVLVTVDNLGVPGAITAEVAARLNKRSGLRPERLAICASHTHSGPALNGAARLILADVTPDEQRHLDQYAREFTDAIEQVAVDALADRQPSRLAWAEGAATFAANRRVLQDGKFTRLGVQPDGPVDHRLPLLAVQDEAGRLRGVLVNYACHCTTLGANNEIGGDWAGHAQEDIERQHPGAVAMVAIGCGADSNPNPRNQLIYAQKHGEEIAREVERLLAGPLAPLPALAQAKAETIELPFGELPTREDFEARVKQKGPIARHAQENLARLDRGEKLPTTLSYRVTVWQFGDELAMVFLPGEVVVDYALRLRRECPGKRLWLNAYANDCPCYIASKRLLPEGGYEVDSSMYYYDRPTRLAPEVEDLIVGAVHRLLPAADGGER
jgi:hypothetical protein